MMAMRSSPINSSRSPKIAKAKEGQILPGKTRGAMAKVLRNTLGDSTLVRSEENIVEMDFLTLAGKAKIKAQAWARAREAEVIRKLRPGHLEYREAGPLQSLLCLSSLLHHQVASSLRSFLCLSPFLCDHLWPAQHLRRYT